MVPTSMTISCGTCPVRGLHCDGCMVTALLDVGARGDERLPLDLDERAALDGLVRAGLVCVDEAAGAHATREPLPLRRRVAG
ncbi:MAG TPA: hypothetical protein VES95_01980 [Dermatophilaceae bacterium]|nr:hypothetical protein [Dermatophilaceae bacterium]